jgi:hypothetical protein
MAEIPETRNSAESRPQLCVFDFAGIMAESLFGRKTVPIPLRQPDPASTPAPEPSVYVLTFEDLVAAARKVDPTITPRAIRKWKDDEDLLPESRPVPEDGKKGRPQNRFPAEAADVVQSLARWRRYARSTVQAETWLSLEGHAYIKPNVHPVFYPGYIAQELVRLQGIVPRLSRVGVAYGRGIAPEDNVRYQEETCEEITEEIDDQIVKPLADGDPKAIEALSVVAILFYLGRLSLNETVELLSETDQDSDVDRSFGLNQDVREIINVALTKLLRVPVTLTVPLTDDELWRLLGSFNLAEQAQRYVVPPRLEWLGALRWRDYVGRRAQRAVYPPSSESINWSQVRYLWRLVCRITDPYLTQEPKRIETAVDLLVVLRRLAFRQDNDAAIRTVFALNFAWTQAPLVRWLECLASEGAPNKENSHID